MVFAVAALLLQFHSIPATLASVDAIPTTTTTNSFAADAAQTSPKPDYIISESESSSSRLNVASVKLISTDSKSATIHPISFDNNAQNGQTLSTIHLPDANSSRENQIERAVETPSRRQWLALAFVEHGAAGFDAYSTRIAIGHGAVEEDPLMRPFAHSPSIYASTQVGPVLFDLLARHMQRSEYPLIRKVWWMPQTLSAGISIFSGVHNLNVASGLQAASVRHR
ncbi:MAG TPA: hypothetical protein VGD60_08740 [Candidatus Acidoferrales bacterium]